MDYKKVLSNQHTRIKLLRMLTWIPDPIMLRIQYRIKMGFWPRFKHPKRFTEKIQLYKMRYRNPNMAKCVDKYEVRDYLIKKGLGSYLNDIYLVCDSINEIDFCSLPQQFVIKNTTGGGGLNVLVVKDKTKIDLGLICSTVSSWELHDKGMISPGREWAYSGIGKTRILVEKYLEDHFSNEKLDHDGLTDYKFFCFNGEPKYIQVDSGRFNNHQQNFYDMNWNCLGVHCTYPEGEQLDIPLNLDEMIRLATLLSEGFPFVRVDLYNVMGQIYFGELTFYPSSGYGRFHPDTFDFLLGNSFLEYK